MLPVSLADLSISQALELLAFRKQAVDAGLVARVPRELLAESDVFRRVGERIQEKNAAQKRAFNPDIGQALALAGSGGLIGGISSLASAPKGQRSLRRVLEGTISGAAMGGGLSALDQAAGTNLGRYVQDAGRAALNRVQSASPAPVASAIGAARGGLADARQAISSAVSPLTAEPDLTGGVTDETLGNLEAGSSAASRLPFYRPAMYAGHLFGTAYGAKRELQKNPAIDRRLFASELRARLLNKELDGKKWPAFVDNVNQFAGRSWRDSFRKIWDPVKSTLGPLPENTKLPKDPSVYLQTAVSRVRSPQDVRRLLVGTNLESKIDDIAKATQARGFAPENLSRGLRGALKGNLVAGLGDVVLNHFEQRDKQTAMEALQRHLQANPGYNRNTPVQP